MVEVYIQGDAKIDSYIFSLLGKYLTDVKMHELLGMPKTSEIGDIWFIEKNKEGECIGFAGARHFKTNKHIHLRFLYSQKNKENLLKLVVQWVKNSKYDLIYTNDRITENAIFKSHGFNIKDIKRHVSFVRYELPIVQGKDN